LGDSSKAKAKLGWEHKISLEKIISEMVEYEKLSLTRKNPLERNF
jgi:GDP-D-mannose dehydratase